MTARIPKADFALERRKPASAVFARPSGASPFAPPLRARIGLLLSQSKVRIPSILTNSIRRQSEFTHKRAAADALANELTVAVQCAESLAQEENWSQRKLAAKLSFCPRTWRRIQNLNVNPADWLPKIRHSLSRLKPGLTFHPQPSPSN